MANQGKNPTTKVPRTPSVTQSPESQPDSCIFEFLTGKAHMTNSKGERITLVPGDRISGAPTSFKNDRRFKLVGPGVVPEKTLADVVSVVVEEPLHRWRLMTGKAHTDGGVLLPGAEKLATVASMKNDNRWKDLGPVEPKQNSMSLAMAKILLEKREREDGTGFDVIKPGTTEPINNTPLTEEEANALIQCDQ